MGWPENAVYWWDCTIPEADFTQSELIDYMKPWFKKMAWQVEEGNKTGYRHYQFRGKLFKKRQKMDKVLVSCKWLPTTKDLQDNWDYIDKAETAIKGTKYKSWIDVDCNEKGQYIARQYRINEEQLFPFQKEIFVYKFDKDKVNVIIDKKGGLGKSTIAHFTRLYKNGIVLPVVNDAKELEQACQNMLSGKKLRKEVIIIIDLPKAVNKERMAGLYTAIERIKSGYVVDMRNKLKEWDFDSPMIWVFTNDAPDMSLLTQRRWNLYTVNENKEFEDYIDFVDDPKPNKKRLIFPKKATG